MRNGICPWLWAGMVALSGYACSTAVLAADHDVTSGKELIGLERAWCTAALNNDLAAMAAMEAEDYVSIGTHGSLAAKNSDQDRSGTVRMSACELSDLKTRRYGDTGIVTGIVSYATESAKGRLHFTDVFVKRNDTWKLVSSHASDMTSAN